MDRREVGAVFDVAILVDVTSDHPTVVQLLVQKAIRLLRCSLVSASRQSVVDSSETMPLPIFQAENASPMQMSRQWDARYCRLPVVEHNARRIPSSIQRSVAVPGHWSTA